MHGNRACVVRGRAVGNVLQSNALAVYPTLLVTITRLGWGSLRPVTFLPCTPQCMIGSHSLFLLRQPYGEGCSSCNSSQKKNSAEIPIGRCPVDGDKMGSLFHTYPSRMCTWKPFYDFVEIF